MKIDLPSAIKLGTFTAVAALAGAASHFGLGSGEIAHTWLGTALELGKEGALALTGHLGVQLLDTTIDEHAGREEQLRGAQNHDLHRLMGEAIARILEREAKHAPGGEYGAKYLIDAATAFRSEWMTVELTGPEAALGEPAVPSYFTGGADPIQKAAVLEKAEWFSLVEKVAGHATFREYDQALAYAADKLREHFAFELWEAAKEAWKEGGLAWPALVLRLLSLILGNASDAAASSAATATQLSELRAEVSALSAAIGKAVANTTAKIPPEQTDNHAEVEVIRAYQEKLDSQLRRLDSRIAEGFADLHRRHDRHDDALARIEAAVTSESRHTGTPGFRDPTELAHPAMLLDPYASVPVLPLNYVERPELQDRVRELILGSNHVVIGLQGMGGVGKTELASKLCHDSRIRASFPDGVVWLEIGRESKRNVLERMKEIAEALNDTPAFYTASNCKKRYRTLLAKKAVLIALEDVWSKTDVEPFITDAPRCLLLFTTRDSRIAASIGAAVCTVETLSDEQARAVLRKSAGLEPGELPIEAEEVIRECGRLPRGLTDIGSALRGKPNERWADMLEKLRKAQIKTLYAPTKVSVDVLGEENPATQRRYLRLAVLLEDMAAPLPILQTLWGVDAITVRETVDELESRSLIRREDDGIRIHALQMDYIRSQYTQQDALPFIHQALRLSSYVVQRDARQFASQLVGRLLPHVDSNGIRQFVAEITAAAPRPWLRPLMPALIAPGGPLVRTLNDTNRICEVAMSGDGKVAVSLTEDRTLRVWDIESGRTLHTFTGGACIAVSADGKRIISPYGDRTLKIWDMGSGRELRTLVGHMGTIRAVTLSGDGKVAISASADQTLRVWDIESGRQLRALSAGNVSDVVLSANGRVAISASRDGMLLAWDVETGERHVLANDYEDSHVAVSDDGKLAVSAPDYGMISVWDVDSRRELYLAGPDEVTGVALSADGTLAVASSEDGTVKVWEVGSKRQLHTLVGHMDVVSGVTASADGKLAVSASWDRTLKVWDLRSGPERHIFARHLASVSGVALSLDGQVAVSASSDNTLKVWNVRSGREMHMLTGHDRPVTGVAVSAEGKIAVSASEDGTLGVWDVGTGRELNTLVGHTDHVSAVALSADGSVAVSVSEDRTLRVWDIKSGRELHNLQGNLTGSINSVAISADGTLALSACEEATLKLWDVAKGRELRTLVGHAAAISSVTLSGDGKVAISASWDRTLRVWDVRSGRELRTFADYTAAARAVALSDDATVAVSASDDNTLKIWDVGRMTCLATFSCDAPLWCCALTQNVVAGGDESGRVHLLALELA